MSTPHGNRGEAPSTVLLRRHERATVRWSPLGRPHDDSLDAVGWPIGDSETARLDYDEETR